MKNIDIINLANGGILAITANDLDAAHAYKVIKFKKAVKKAFESIVESEKEILKEAGIEDAQAFDKERKEYFEYYTGKVWGGKDCHDFSVDSSMFGIDGTVDLIIRIADKKLGL